MKQKNAGIEFLRIIAMFMVLLLHLNGQGGILKNVPAYGVNYWIAYFIQCASFCCVNCFAMISGYVTYDKKEKPSRILSVYLQTLFYSATIVATFAVLYAKYRNVDAILTAVLPIMRDDYWYVSAYIGVCVLMPILNKAIQSLDKKKMTVFLLTSFFFFSILPTFVVFSADLFRMDGGYSTIWLCWLYLLGGYIKKYDIIESIGTWKARTTYAAAVGFAFVSELLLVYGGKAIFGEPKMEGQFLTYTSPMIVIAAAALFIACAKMKLGEKTGRVVQTFSKAAFGVYLIHLCPPVWNEIIRDCAKDFASKNVVVMLGLMFLTAIAIYLLCSAIEFVRIGLFKLCRIDRLGKKLDDLIEKRIENSKLLANTSENTECVKK